MTSSQSFSSNNQADISNNKGISPVILCILDGWGERQEEKNNAISLANTPNWDQLVSQSPKSHLHASETFVGLPSGQMGNSEVGHMNLGAGRIVMQDLPRIDESIQTKSYKTNTILLDFINALKQSGGAAHLTGLLSPGGVHAHQDQMAALANFLISEGISVKIHAILDGRDTAPQSAKEFIQAFQKHAPKADIATISGRFYAMDRDNNWDRVQLAVNAMTAAQGDQQDEVMAAIDASYADEKFDEFVLPTIIGDYKGMQDGDGLFMTNFRADRAREILTALLDPNFTDFQPARSVKFTDAIGMVEYSKSHNDFIKTVFPPAELTNTLGAVIAQNGLKQLRIAETEKYAHVTFFFNGGDETIFDGEERILIPSPKVKTYDMQPEMSAPEVTDNLVDAIENNKFDVIVVNFANTDMVGHTGNLEAAIKAVEAVDICLGRLLNALKDTNGAMLVTADHGNAETMLNEQTGQRHTSHTLNPVPFVLANADKSIEGLSVGRLADVAPTILDLLGIPQPSEMTGESLLIRKSAHIAAE